MLTDEAGSTHPLLLKPQVIMGNEGIGINTNGERVETESSPHSLFSPRCASDFIPLLWCPVGGGGRVSKML